MRPGLRDPVLDSQRVFRRVLEAMAHPGLIVSVEPALDPPTPLGPASAAVCLTLVDHETPLWLDAAARTTEAVEWLQFHCGPPLAAEPASARFALVGDARAMPAVDAYDAGTDAAPDRSATLILQVDELIAGHGRCLKGPGIRDAVSLGVRGVGDDFWAMVRANAARFPRGVDIILAAGTRLAALPRTVRVEA